MIGISRGRQREIVLDRRRSSFPLFFSLSERHRLGSEVGNETTARTYAAPRFSMAGILNPGTIEKINERSIINTASVSDHERESRVRGQGTHLAGPARDPAPH
jgi:hypothetical protein